VASPVDAPDRLCGTYPEHSNLAPDDKRILSFGSFILPEFSHDIRSVSLGPSADTLACNRRAGGHGSWRAPALGPKGTRNHRTLGYIWVGLMVIVAFSGLYIHVLKLVGPFSPIHLLSATGARLQDGGRSAGRPSGTRLRTGGRGPVTEGVRKSKAQGHRPSCR